MVVDILNIYKTTMLLTTRAGHKLSNRPKPAEPDGPKRVESGSTV